MIDPEFVGRLGDLGDDGTTAEHGADPTMTVPELARRVGIDASTAYRYLRAGRLPGVHVGSNWLIDRERVERFMAGREDAAGRPLIQESPATETSLVPPVSLTLVPEWTPNSAQTALNWLRGAQAALELLTGAAAGTGHPQAHEGTEHRSFRA